MRSNSRRGSASLRIGSSPKIRAAIRPLVDALERRLLLSSTLPSFAQPSPDAVYYTGGTSGAMTLDVTAGTIAFNANVADDGSDWQNLTVEASGSAHLIFNSPQTLSSLGLFDNATVTLSQGNSAGGGNFLQLNTLVVNPTATLDLGDSAMILYYQPSEQSSDLSTVQSLLKSGYNGGAWNGTGIDSSSAANDPSKDTSLGYMDNNDLQSPYAGINFTQFNQIIVGYTYYGDVDLNRSFDSTDVDQLIAGRSGQGSGWEYGDFNYDGYTDDADTTIFTNEHAKWQQQLIDTGQYTPAFHLAPLPIQPDWNTPFDGDIATFTDTVNTNLDASAYVADVYWGDGSLSIAQVTATNTPGSFRINAISPVFTTANPIMLMTLQYAPGSGYQSESAIAGEPIDVLQLPPGVNASANAVYSISGPSGNVQLNLTAGSLAFDTNASNDSNYFQNLNFTVSGSAHAYFNSPQDFNALTIKDNAIVTLSRGGGGANGNRLNVQSLSIDPNATLDLADNALIDWYAIGAGAAARSQMQSWVQSGYDGGKWDHPGIVSSIAADDTTGLLGVGWMDDGYDYVDHSIDPSYSTFAGVNLQSKNQMLVRLAYYGDANLDGQVDDTDLYLWHSGYLGNGYTGWVYGDFNYDGVVDNTTDLNAWTANYGLSTTTGNFARAFQPTGILINPTEGVPFSGDIATFYDILNPSNTDASIYTAQVDWGDGHFVAAQVTATSSPGYFRINALSPALTDSNAVMAVIIKYADMTDPSPTYQGRPAAVVEPITMTPAVANLTATAISTSEIDLAWTLNAPNASAIEVDRSTDGINWSTVTDTLSGTATSFADTTGLAEATHYYYRVRAIQPIAASSFTNDADTWTLASPPSNFTVMAVGANEIDLSWTSAASGVTGFNVQRSEDGGATFEDIAVVDAGTTTFQDQDITEGTTYTYQISAITDGGEGQFTSAATATTGPISPTDLTASAVSDTEIDLNWDDPSNVSTGYIIERADDSGDFIPVGNATDTSYQDTGLDPDKEYNYRVVSKSESEATSSPSDPQSATTDPAPIKLILGDGTVGRGDSYTLDVGYQVLDGGTSIDYPTSVNIDWGDGTSDAVNEADPWFAHTYNTRGVYKINVTATAPAGVFSAESKVIVGANPIAMGFDADLSQSQFDVGNAVQFTASLGGDALDLLHVSKWVVDWGDGSGLQDFTPSSADPTDQTFSHSYSNGGTTFDAAITAVTDQGLVTGDESVTVKAPEDNPNYPTQSQVNIVPTNGNGGNGGNNGGNNGSSSAVNQGFTIDPCAGVVLDYPWIIGWGDGAQSSTSTSGSFNHPYSSSGQYYVTVSVDNQVVAGKWVTVNSSYIPTVSPVADQIVSTGDAVNVSATAGEIYYNEDYEGYVNWGDGTGLHLTNYQLAVPNATLSAKLDAAGDPGQYAASLYLYGINEPNNRSGLVSGRSFKINVSSFSLNVADLPDASQPSPNKMDPGVFIPINDNYDAGEDVPDDQLPLPNADDPQLVDASLTLSGASGAQATWSLNFPSSIDVFEVQQDGTLTPVTSGQASGPVTLEPDGTDVSLELEGISADANILLQAAMTPVSGQLMAASATDQAKAQTAEFGLNAYTQTIDANGNNLSGPELDLSNKDKVNAGVFVPVNNADEAYKVANGQLTLDKNVSGPIAGEDETLALVVHTGDLSTVAPGSFKLSFPGFLRVYQNSDRSGPVKTNTPIPVTHDGDMLLYVEGYTGGTGTISLLLPGSGVPAYKLKITAFEWTGALNVPQNGTYEYKVTNPTRNATNNPDGGKWLAPVHGSQTLHGVNGQQGTNNSDVDIQWGAGPAVGEAVYEASPDFVWSLGVNIVQISISTPPGAFSRGTPYDGGSLSNKLVYSGITGLAWKATVTLKGVGDGNRGVDLIKIGFVQNLTFTAFSGTYRGGAVVSKNYVGKTYWDTINRGVDDADKTYVDKRYSTKPGTYFDNWTSSHLVQTIASSDTPYGGPFLYDKGQPLQSMKLVWDFQLYVTANAKNTTGDNGAGNVYTPQAFAAWQFDGSGTIGPPPTNAFEKGFKWKGPGSVTPPTTWAPPGSNKPIVTGTRANNLL